MERGRYATILVADSSHGLRTTLRILLEAAANVRVLEAANAVEALRQFHDNRIDMLICDVDMPGLEREQLGHLLDSRHPRPEVIVMGSEPPRGEPPLESVVAWLDKPFDPQVLVDLVSAGAMRRTGS